MLQLSFSIGQNGIYKPFVITHRSTYLCLHVSEIQRNAIGYVAVANLERSFRDAIGYVRLRVWRGV